MLPYAKGYKRVNIQGYWNILRYDTIGDGSCLLHAIFNACFKPYREGVLHGKVVDRRQMVKDFRNELADCIAEDDVYESLHRGYLSKFSKDIDDYSQANMIKELRSDCNLGYGYFHLISMQIEKDIYIISGDEKDVYITDEYEHILSYDRPAIVLYIQGEHFETVGVETEKGQVNTCFSPDHEFIKYLQKRIRVKNKTK